MKTITLEEVIQILASCAAVIVDDTVVTFPNVTELEGDREDNVFLEIESVTTERFKSDVNENPPVDMQGRIVLTNTRGEATKFMPLVASPVE